MSRLYRCTLCGGEEVQETRGACRLYCLPCAADIQKKRQREADMRYRARRGGLVGVGSGGAQLGSQNAQWRGGRSSPTYRRLAFEAHGRFCVLCGSNRFVEVHHRDGNRENNNAANLQPLCKSCHRSAMHDCVTHLQFLSPSSKAKAEQKRTRNSCGQYTSRRESAEKTGTPREGQSDLKSDKDRGND